MKFIRIFIQIYTSAVLYIIIKNQHKNFDHSHGDPITAIRI